MIELGTESGRRQVELPPLAVRGDARIERRLGEDYVVLERPEEATDPASRRRLREELAASRRRLVEEVAAIWDRRDVVSFVARWGMLAPAPELPDEARNPPDPARLRWVEPLEAYRSAAHAFSLVLQIYAAIRDAAPDEAEAALEALRPAGLTKDLLAGYPSTLEKAADLIAEVVNAGLEGVEEQLAPGAAAGDNRVLFAFAGRASTLRQYAYHALADLLAANAAVAECANPACGVRFEVRHGRQQYHDRKCMRRHRDAIRRGKTHG